MNDLVKATGLIVMIVSLLSGFVSSEKKDATNGILTGIGFILAGM